MGTLMLQQRNEALVLSKNLKLVVVVVAVVVGNRRRRQEVASADIMGSAVLTVYSPFSKS